MSTNDRLTCADGSPTMIRRQPVAAVVGAASSQVSVMVASMLQLFKVYFIKKIIKKIFFKENILVILYFVFV